MPSPPAPQRNGTVAAASPAPDARRLTRRGVARSRGTASPYTATLSPAAPLTVYLQVGVGGFTNDYIYGGQPQNNTTVNTVSTTLAADVVGNGTAQAMTTNSTAAQSYWDGYTYCSVPGQLYIGGFYRTTGAHDRRGTGDRDRARRP